MLKFILLVFISRLYLLLLCKSNLGLVIYTINSYIQINEKKYNL